MKLVWVCNVVVFAGVNVFEFPFVDREFVGLDDDDGDIVVVVVDDGDV